MTEGYHVHVTELWWLFTINFVLVTVPDQLINELAVLRIAFANFLCEYECELQKIDEVQKKFVKMVQILLQVDESLKLSECFKRLIEKEVTLFNITYMEKLCEVFPQNVR